MGSMGRMRPALATAAVLVALAMGSVMCSGSATTIPGESKCTPGASVACAGPGGCTGYQVCGPNGDALGACMCPGASAEAGTDAPSSSSGSSTSSSGSSTSGGSGTSGSSGSSGGPASSGSSSSGAGSGSGSGVDSGADAGSIGIGWGATIPSGDLGTPVTLATSTFQVPAGGEVYKCLVFANPFSGVNTDVVVAHGTMSAGSHAFYVFNITSLEANVEPTVGTLGDCAGKGLEFHPLVFFAQQQDWTRTFPAASDGSPMGYPLAGANYLMMDLHYLNTGSSVLNVSASVTLTPAKAGVVTTHVGSIFLNQTTMSVPITATVQAPYVSSMTWGGDNGTLPTSYRIITSWSHMHKWGLGLSASTGGTQFYSETNWDAPGLFLHAPGQSEPSTATGTLAPILMTGNPTITWSCSDYNDSGATLSFGDSAKSNVQCIYIGEYYPASTSAPDDIAVLN